MFEDIFKNKKVLITGNTGFKGSWLSLWLLKLGAKVYGLSNEVPTEPSMFYKLKINEHITYYNDNVRDLNAVRKAVTEIKPDFVFHLAAQALVSVSYLSPVDTIETNVIGTTNVMEALRISNHICTAVIITSDKCYDNVEWEWGYKETDVLGGKDIYSGSKGAAEIVFKSYYHSFFNKPASNVKIATARAGNVIGGGDWAQERIIPDCMRAWSKGEVVEIRSPNATRPWQFVMEPLSGYLNLAQELFLNNDLNGHSFNFGPLAQYSHTVENILCDLSELWRFKKSSDAYKITDVIKFHEAGLLKLNCDKALLHLKWFATLNYNELIAFTGSWYYSYYNKNEDMFEYSLKQIKEYELKAKAKKLKWTN